MLLVIVIVLMLAQQYINRNKKNEKIKENRFLEEFPMKINFRFFCIQFASNSKK